MLLIVLQTWFWCYNHLWYPSTSCTAFVHPFPSHSHTPATPCIIRDTGESMHSTKTVPFSPVIRSICLSLPSTVMVIHPPLLQILLFPWHVFSFLFLSLTLILFSPSSSSPSPSPHSHSSPPYLPPSPYPFLSACHIGKNSSSGTGTGSESSAVTSSEDHCALAAASWKKCLQDCTRYHTCTLFFTPWFLDCFPFIYSLQSLPPPISFPLPPPISQLYFSASSVYHPLFMFFTNPSTLYSRFYYLPVWCTLTVLAQMVSQDAFLN